MPYSPGLRPGVVPGNLQIAGNLQVDGNTTLGNAAADTLTTNYGIVTINNNQVITRAAGIVATGVVNFFDLTMTATGDPGGGSNIRGIREVLQGQNANTIGAASVRRSEFIHGGSGLVGSASGVVGSVSIENTGNSTLSRCFLAQYFSSSSGASTSARYFEAQVPSITGAGGVTDLVGVRIPNIGHALVVTATGLQVADFTASTFMRGLQLALTAGANKHNLYIDGSADNYIAGAVGIGFTTLTGFSLRVGRNMTGAVDAYSIANESTVQSDVTTAATGFSSTLSTAAAAFTLPAMYHYRVIAGTIGAGSVVTNQYGLFVPGSIREATTNYGVFFGDSAAIVAGKTYYAVRSLVNIASGGGVTFGLYFDGTAQNYLNGATGIGIVPAATSNLTLAASTTAKSSLNIPHGAAPTAPVNGDMWTTTAGLFVRINGVTVGPLT